MSEHGGSVIQARLVCSSEARDGQRWGGAWLRVLRQQSWQHSKRAVVRSAPVVSLPKAKQGAVVSTCVAEGDRLAVPTQQRPPRRMAVSCYALSELMQLVYAHTVPSLAYQRARLGA